MELQVASKKELYQQLIDKIDELLGGVNIAKAPKDFPVKKSTYYNIKNWLSGDESMSKKLYQKDNLESICIELKMCDSLEKQEIYILS